MPIKLHTRVKGKETLYEKYISKGSPGKQK